MDICIPKGWHNVRQYHRASIGKSGSQVSINDGPIARTSRDGAIPTDATTSLTYHSRRVAHGAADKNIVVEIPDRRLARGRRATGDLVSQQQYFYRQRLWADSSFSDR